MVVFHDNSAASKAFHAVSTGCVSPAVDADINVEWLQPATDAASSSSYASDSVRNGEPGEEHAGAGDRASGSVGSHQNAASHSSHDRAGASAGANGEAGESSAGGSAMPSFSSWQPGGANDDSILNHRDYESITLMR